MFVNAFGIGLNDIFTGMINFRNRTKDKNLPLVHLFLCFC